MNHKNKTCWRIILFNGWQCQKDRAWEKSIISCVSYSEGVATTQYWGSNIRSSSNPKHPFHVRIGWFSSLKPIKTKLSIQGQLEAMGPPLHVLVNLSRPVTTADRLSLNNNNKIQTPALNCRVWDFFCFACFVAACELLGKTEGINRSNALHSSILKTSKGRNFPSTLLSWESMEILLLTSTEAVSPVLSALENPILRIGE